jgi:hypothetical protein
MVRVLLGWTLANPPETARARNEVRRRKGERKEGSKNAPNHFFDSLAEPSITSSTPGLRASIEGTWLARLSCCAAERE